MRHRRSFLEETTDRSRILSKIASLNLTVRQDMSGYYLQHAWQREQHFTKADVPAHFTCANPRCQRGGLDLQRVVLFSEPSNLALFYQGHEGSPKGAAVAIHATINSISF